MKYYKIIFLFAAIGIFLEACKDILDKKPLNTISSADVWNDPNLVEAYISNLYSGLAFLKYEPSSGDTFDYGLLEALTDEAGGTRYNRAPSQWKAGYLNESGGLLELWDYSSIRKMNEFYQAMEKSTISDDQKKLFIGTVKFAEAFLYFEMAKRYGAVPIIKKAQDINDPYDELFPHRDPEASVYRYCIKILDEIYSQKLLPETSVKSGYPTLGAILALKSQIGLFAASISKWGSVQLNGLLGVPKDEEQEFWTLAYNAANDLIKSNQYSLYEKYPDSLPMRFYQMSIDRDNPERIFVKQYDGLNVSHLYDFRMLPTSYYNRDSYNLAPYLDFVEGFEKVDGSDGTIPREWATNQILVTSNELFGNYDPRMEGGILHEGSIFKNIPVEFYNGLRLPDGRILTGEGTTYQGMSVIGKDRQVNVETRLMTGFGVRKYLDESYQGVGFQSSTDKIIFRLGEVYLERAEAAFYLGMHDQALNDINIIRERAGMPKHSNIDEEKIRYERYAELCFEDGARYWDLIRWRIAANRITKVFHGLDLVKDFQTGKYLVNFLEYTGSARPFYSQFRQEHYYKPITPTRISNNPNLAPENPGY